ncbi:hypothetical protein UPYG_G00214650 [Umbra pygmaea]|uniref:Ig-like domain-containing protein n=1 Tax=Umbra pygmaea TaxID=75934 RepID=A0ABD0WQB9_UMBPY
MLVVVGFLMIFAALSNGMLTSFCDVTVDGSQCYGALGGTVYLHLITDAEGYDQLELKKDPSGQSLGILKMKNNSSIINQTINSRSSFFINNGTFMITNIERSDAAEYQLETFKAAVNKVHRRFKLSITASGFPPQLSSECLSQGEVRVSCFSERGSPQYSWTLDGFTLDTTMAFISDITDTVILKKGIVGSLACRVNNDINTPTVTWDISPCTALWINVLVYVKCAEIFILLAVCLASYWFYRKKTCPTVQVGSRGAEGSPVDHV